MTFFFFFQAEDGIRDKLVTGVQTCALPIYLSLDDQAGDAGERSSLVFGGMDATSAQPTIQDLEARVADDPDDPEAHQALGEALIERSEEHTSELQSLAYLVCRLLLEKKKEVER